MSHSFCSVSRSRSNRLRPQRSKFEISQSFILIQIIFLKQINWVVRKKFIQCQYVGGRFELLKVVVARQLISCAIVLVLNWDYQNFILNIKFSKILSRVPRIVGHKLEIQVIKNRQNLRLSTFSCLITSNFEWSYNQFWHKRCRHRLDMGWKNVHPTDK